MRGGDDSCVLDPLLVCVLYAPGVWVRARTKVRVLLYSSCLFSRGKRPISDKPYLVRAYKLDKTIFVDCSALLVVLFLSVLRKKLVRCLFRLFLSPLRLGVGMMLSYRRSGRRNELLSGGQPPTPPFSFLLRVARVCRIRKKKEKWRSGVQDHDAHIWTRTAT